MGLMGKLRKFETLSAVDVEPLVRSGAILIDVRSDAEWRAGRAPKARHVPLDRVDAEVAKLGVRTGSDPAPLVFVCRSGARSAKAARAAGKAGRTAYSVTGGMAAWHQAGLPVVLGGGKPGRVI
jgi:rhodanese-related sulfurtransferase